MAPQRIVSVAQSLYAHSLVGVTLSWRTSQTLRNDNIGVNVSCKVKVQRQLFLNLAGGTGNGVSNKASELYKYKTWKTLL